MYILYCIYGVYHTSPSPVDSMEKLSRSDQGYPLRRCARNFDDKLDILRGDGRLWKPKCQKKSR